MGYIGNSPALKYTSFAVQHFTTSATTSYALDHAVTNENDIRLVINNVVQQPGSGKAYTATGTTLTLTGATTGTDTMYCVFLGKAIQTVTPPVGSVGSSELSADIITGQSALGAAPADTDEFLVSDAGTLKRVDYSYIKGITQTSFSPTAEPLIINGDFAIAQRATAATTITHQGYNTVDRWSQNFTAGTSMVFTAERSTTAPTDQGFGYSWKIDCTTAEASLAATSRLMLYTKLEGQDCQLLKFGTSSAETITLSFWVRSNKTGTYQVNMWNSTLSGYISSTYAISVADTWEKKILTFAGDQNTALTNNNASTGLQAEFVLVGGGNYTGGTMVPDTTTSWPGYPANTRAANQTVNLADSTSNDFYITGVQLEVGEYTSSDLPPFRHESFGDNMARCQRYYQSNYRDGVYPGASTTNAGTWSGAFYGTDFLTQFTLWQVRMRTNPTITFYTRTGTAGSWYAGVYQVNEAVDTVVSSINTPTGWQATVSGVASNTDVAYGYYVGDAEL